MGLRLAFVGLLLAPTLAVAQMAPTERTQRVLIVGDSHVERLGPMLEGVVEDAGFSALGSLSHRGWSTARFVREAQLSEEIRAFGQPDVVIVALGGNDRPQSIEAYRQALSWVVGQARSTGAERIVWLGPTQTDARRSERARRTGIRHERNADWQREILPALGVSWIDSAPVTRRHHARDGVHYTARGYRGWALAAFEAGHLLQVTRPQVVPPIRLGLGLSSPSD